jgi:hypothetical protein
MLNQFDKRAVATTDLTPEPVSSSPPVSPTSAPPGIASVADALREAARLAAVRDLLAEREQELRAWLEAKAATHTAAEGTAFNCPVKGLGRAYVTEPGIRLEPLDQAAFGAWALASRPGQARHRLVAVAERIDRWLNAPGGDAGDRAARLRELLDDPKAVEESVLLSEALLEELAATCVVTEDGTVVDVETGETVPVRAVPNSAPTLVIRVDRPARRRFVAELRRRFPMLGQPAVRPAPSVAPNGRAGESRQAG